MPLVEWKRLVSILGKRLPVLELTGLLREPGAGEEIPASGERPEGSGSTPPARDEMPGTGGQEKKE